MLLKHIRATRFVILLIATLYAGLSIGCFDKGSSQPAVGNVEDARSYQVVAVSYPLQYLTQRIAGDAINVRLPMPSESTDPQNWRPSRESVSQMQAADLIIANGTGATNKMIHVTWKLVGEGCRGTGADQAFAVARMAWDAGRTLCCVQFQRQVSHAIMLDESPSIRRDLNLRDSRVERTG